MIRKFLFLNNVNFQAALITISLSIISLVVSIILYGESVEEIALAEVENKAIIFLSSLESSVRSSVQEEHTENLIDLIRNRAEQIDKHMGFAIVAVSLRDKEGGLLEYKTRASESALQSLRNPRDEKDNAIPQNFYKVVESGEPFVERQFKSVNLDRKQRRVPVIDALYPITDQNGELVAVLKIGISVERTFELIWAEYWRFTFKVVLGLIVVTGLLIAGILFFLKKRIIAPVLSINDGAKEVAAGDLSVSLKPAGSNEIRTLIRSFNKMVRGLQHRDQLRQSLLVAQEIQQNLLPSQPPELEGVQIAGRSVYCDETGGDYFDFIKLDQNGSPKLGVVIGDVSGHGISSALLMTTARAFLRQRSALPGSAAEVITDVNHLLTKDMADSGNFMALNYLVLDRENRSLEWVRAGHDPAILYNPADDSITELKGTGIIMGVDEDFRYTGNTREGLHDGQIILLGTDGIWESRNIHKEMFGKDALYEILRTNKSMTASEILEKVMAELDRFRQGAEIDDDVTLVVLKLTAPA